MIKFIILLPFKIIGVIFLAIGAALDNSNRRRIEREKQAEKQRREYERIAAAREYEKRIAAAQKEEERRARAARIATERAQRSARIEKEKLEKRKAVESKKAFQIEQAKTDIIHYQSQRRDLLKLYNELQKQYDAATAENRKETLYRKILAINNQIRAADRIIERLQYTIGTG